MRRARRQREEEQLLLRGLRRQLNETTPWWWPGNRGRRADLKARITERQHVVSGLGEQLHQAEQRVSKLLAALSAVEIRSPGQT